MIDGRPRHRLGWPRFQKRQSAENEHLPFGVMVPE